MRDSQGQTGRSCRAIFGLRAQTSSDNLLVREKRNTSSIADEIRVAKNWIGLYDLNLTKEDEL